MIDISVIIVNYKTAKMTGECIESVLASKNVSLEVIVVDNKSDDGSVEYFKNHFPQITTIANTANAGFAHANNLGISQAKGKYVWLLNSDTIIEPSTISTLLKNATDSKALIASCKLLNRDGSIQPQGGDLPNLVNLTAWMLNFDDFPIIKKLIPPYQNRDIEAFKHDRLCGWLGGTAFLVKRDIYESLNGLDQNIFMYGEDTDFCFRAHQKGIAIHYFAAPQLIHLGQQSGSKPLSLVGEFKGLKYYFKKHRNSFEFLYIRLILRIGAALRYILYAIKGDQELKGAYAKAFNVA